jgi:hypothetical protein
MAINQPRGRRDMKASPAKVRSSGHMPQTQRATRLTENRPADPQASIARYTSLAINAAASGDFVQAETYYQQAEYYRKLMQGAPE